MQDIAVEEATVTAKPVKDFSEWERKKFSFLGVKPFIRTDDKRFGYRQGDKLDPIFQAVPDDNANFFSFR